MKSTFKKLGHFITAIFDRFLKLSQRYEYVEKLSDTCVVVSEHNRTRQFTPFCNLTAEGVIEVNCRSCVDFQQYCMPCSHLLRGYHSTFIRVLLKKGLNLEHFLADSIEPAYFARNVCSVFNDTVKVICPSRFKCVEMETICTSPTTELRVKRGMRWTTRLPSKGEGGRKRRRSSYHKKAAVAEEFDEIIKIEPNDLFQSNRKEVATTEELDDRKEEATTEEPDIVDLFQSAFPDRKEEATTEEPDRKEDDGKEEVTTEELDRKEEEEATDEEDDRKEEATTDENKVPPPPPGVTLQSLTTKQNDNENSCFAIALLLGEAFLSTENDIVEKELVETVMDVDALMLVRFLRDMQCLEERDYIDMNKEIQDSKELGFLAGEIVPSDFTLPEVPEGEEEEEEEDNEMDDYDPSLVIANGMFGNRDEVENLIKHVANEPTHCYCL